MEDKSYILGTHRAEIERLGLQHRVWRPYVLDAWRRAGITLGQIVVDVGCGPGFATIDLAEIVGPEGRVIGFERSARFLDHLGEIARSRSLEHISTVEADLDEVDLLSDGADAAWCRWVLSFVTRPAAVVGRVAASLKPGGVAIFHEYLDYGTWRLAPREEAFEIFVDAVMRSWRSSGGEPDIALQLPEMLGNAGLQIDSMRPLIDAVTPASFVWQWPEAFMQINLERMLELGFVTEEEAASALAALHRAKARPGGYMVTPCVLEVIARKPV